MKRILLIIVCLILLCGCEKEKTDEEKEIASVKKTTCTEITPLIEDGAILIDVRTKEEYDVDHIENAINLSSETIKYTIMGKVSDYETPIIVYCQSGRRSAESAKILTEMGYQNVYDMGSITSCYGEE